MAVGLTEVPCIELTVNDQQALEIALIENLQRKDLTAFEEADGYRTLTEKYDYTHQQVGDAVGRSRVTVSESLRLLQIPGPIRELCRHADISAKGVLLEIARVDDEAAMRELIQEIVEERLDRAAVRRRRAGVEHSAADNSSTKDVGEITRKPFMVRFRNPDRSFSLSLSFRTEREPEPRQVIEALKEVIRELESALEEDPS
jgi:ParB family chromosome partitioning protein